MKIGAILILYNPNLELLNSVILSTQSQVDSICVIDNTVDSVGKAFFYKYRNTCYIPLGKNIGIAAAQNIGISYFVDLNFDYVLLIDQDSILYSNMVVCMLNSYAILQQRGHNVAVVGTKAINRETGLPYKEEYPILSKFSLDSYNFLLVNSCRSSVSLISTNNFKKVGGMESELFIDGVDNEWCWRAKSRCNLNSYVLENSVIEHKLGQGDKSFLWYKVSIPSSFRVYYEFRNYFILCRRNYVPSVWKYKNGIKYIIKLFYYPVFVPPRISYLKSISKGIRDGLFKSEVR